MGSSYSRRTRSSPGWRSKVGSTSDSDFDNNFSSTSNSDSVFTHERKDSKKFWISHVKFRRSSGDIQAKRPSCERKQESRQTSNSNEQTKRHSKTELSKKLSFDSAQAKSSNTNGNVDTTTPEASNKSSQSAGLEEKVKIVENSFVVNGNTNIKNRLMSNSQLYNILNDGSLSPCICDPTYILLIDTRDKQQYDDNHVFTAQHVAGVTSVLQEDGLYGLQSRVNPGEFTWLVIYGEKLPDDAGDDNNIIKLMHELDAKYDSEAFVLSSGYKSFYNDYPFLCTDHVNIDFKTLKVYPSIIIENQLYQGRGDQATNIKVINDLGITHIVNITQEHASAFPDQVTYLTLKLDDVSQTQLIKHFDKTTEFLTNALSSNGRVLVHCNLGVSRSSTVSIAYLIQANKWTLRQAYDFLKDKRTCIRPNRGFLKQLALWEELKLGKKYTDPDDLWF